MQRSPVPAVILLLLAQPKRKSASSCAASAIPITPVNKELLIQPVEWNDSDGVTRRPRRKVNCGFRENRERNKKPLLFFIEEKYGDQEISLWRPGGH
jgi:hypothetical protein